MSNKSCRSHPPSDYVSSQSMCCSCECCRGACQCQPAEPSAHRYGGIGESVTYGVLGESCSGPLSGYGVLAAKVSSPPLQAREPARPVTTPDERREWNLVIEFADGQKTSMTFSSTVDGMVALQLMLKVRSSWSRCEIMPEPPEPAPPVHRYGRLGESYESILKGYSEVLAKSSAKPLQAEDPAPPAEDPKPSLSLQDYMAANAKANALYRKVAERALLTDVPPEPPAEEPKKITFREWL